MIHISTTRDRPAPITERLRPALNHLLDQAAGQVVADARATVLNNKESEGASPLADSIRVRTTENERIVEATAPYARFVEMGTRRMAARPFLRPALVMMRGRLAARIRHLIGGTGS